MNNCILNSVEYLSNRKCKNTKTFGDIIFKARNISFQLCKNTCKQGVNNKVKFKFSMLHIKKGMLSCLK